MYHELAYLHPKRFTPKPVWDLLGIEPDTRFAIVRFVKWDAFHDTQLVGGFTLEQKCELIARLSKHLRVFISSESELPADLEPYRIHIPIDRMHDVQAAAALFVGEVVQVPKHVLLRDVETADGTHRGGNILEIVILCIVWVLNLRN